MAGQPQQPINHFHLLLTLESLAISMFATIDIHVLDSWNTLHEPAETPLFAKAHNGLFNFAGLIFAASFFHLFNRLPQEAKAPALVATALLTLGLLFQTTMTFSAMMEQEKFAGDPGKAIYSLAVSQAGFIIATTVMAELLRGLYQGGGARPQVQQGTGAQPGRRSPLALQ